MSLIDPEPNDPAGNGAPPGGSTADLIARAQVGDPGADEELYRRFREPLRRWAHGRLPAIARGMIDTDDLVQTTLQRSLLRLRKFTPQHEGAFLGYLRKTLRNLILDEVRKAAIRGEGSRSLSELASDTTSPLEAMIGTELFETYDRALHRLPARQRHALYLRIEFQYPYARIAEAIDCSSENAARHLVARSLVRLAVEMRALDGTKRT